MEGMRIMGGRGANYKKQPVAMTIDEYLMKKGVLDPMSGYSIDKTWGANQFGQTESGKRKFYKEFQKAEDDYHKKRMDAINEYKALLASGKVRDKTQIEKSMETARGHEDLASTHAARRMLAKRGIDWKTGKKIR